MTQIRKLSLTYLVKSEFTNFRPSLKAISHDRDRIKRNQQSITSLVCYRINSCEYSSITDRIISYLLFLTFESKPSIVIILYLVDKKKEKIKIYEKFKLKNEIFFFQSFTWNLGRPVDEVEVLQLSVISRGVLKNEKVLAKYGLVLQTVVREGRIDITDFLVDLNNKPLPVSWNNAHDNEFPCSIPYRAI